jgi:hypothetical protein
MMAVLVLGDPIKTNLDGPSGAMAYIINPTKTLGGTLVTSNYETTGTSASRLARPMIRDNENAPQGIRRNSRLAYHLKMSFSPDDPVTAERAHALGVELARSITGGDYRFVVATHTDRHHLHNHIMICAAARQAPHLKAELPKDIIAQWRELCDGICRREGLSVIEKPAEPVLAYDADSPDGPAVTKPEAETADMDARERHGISMGELYAAAKGHGVKDRIRTMVDLAAAQARDFGELQSMLSMSGVKVEMRGRHLTFTWMETGFRIRDDRLGVAYRPDDIMARISRCKVLPITFNQRLVAGEDEGTVTVWLPGSSRRRRITIPRERVIASGSTWRAWLPDNRRQTITDRRGRIVGSTITAGLYQWFGRPDAQLATLAGEKLRIEAGVSPAQRRYYTGVGRRVDMLERSATALNAAIEWSRRAGGDANKGVALLRDRIRDEHAALQAAVIALTEAIDTGDERLEAETRGEMEARERALTRLEDQLSGIERTAKRTRDDPEGDETARGRKPQRVITRGRRN